jgi:alcohol dehydrogenase
MDGCCFVDVGTVRAESLTDPELVEPGDAIVKVEMAGLCGSDLHPFFGRETGLDPGTVMGHEFVGRVVSTGDAVSAVQVGDRVCCPFSTNCGDCFYCLNGLTSRCSTGQLFGWREDGVGLHGGQAQWIRVPHANGSLLPVPDSLSNETALLLGDNLSTGFYSADLAEVQNGGVYLVVGCGTVGLLAIVAALFKGAKKVFCYDPDASRRELAEAVGGTPVLSEQAAVSEVKQATGGRGADGVMELVGLLPAQQLAWRAVRPGGILSSIGCHCKPEFGFSQADAYDKNLTYRTGRCPARHYMRELNPVIDRIPFDLDSLITHRFEIRESTCAYEVFSRRQDGCIKAAFCF